MSTANVFGGAERFTRYADTATSPAITTPKKVSLVSSAPESAVDETNLAPPVLDVSQTQVGQDHTGTAQESSVWAKELVRSGDLVTPVVSPRSPSRWHGILAFFKIKPRVHEAPAETGQEERQVFLETLIRQKTWTRAVNIAVLSTKGGAGTTPGSLLVAGILADIRGGSVCVFEATSSTGTLAIRAEGTPKRGLSELLAAAESVDSAGNLAGYTAPQSSHAAVIGTITPRAQLNGQDVLKVRKLLDHYYQITVTDADSNLGSPAGLVVQQHADAVIIPALATPLGVTTAMESVNSLHKHAPHLFAGTPYPPRIAIVLADPGTGQDALTTHALRTRLDQALKGTVTVLDAPYDPIFMEKEEISLADALVQTRAAWTCATAAVIENIDDAPHPLVEGEN